MLDRYRDRSIECVCDPKVPLDTATAINADGLRATTAVGSSKRIAGGMGLVNALAGLTELSTAEAADSGGRAGKGGSEEGEDDRGGKVHDW